MELSKTVFLLVAVCIASSAAAPNRPRIVNGTDADIEKIPYQISLQFFNSHTCGGAILSKDTIVTAAHCLDYFSEHHSMSTITVRVGSSHLQSDGIVYNISRFIVHENYDQDTYDYDIALLKLETELEYSDSVQPVVVGRSRNDLQEGQIVQVSGWGRTRTGGPLASVLQKIEMPVIGQQDCVRIFSSINDITDRMFCAGYLDGSGDSCNGDSGGPLVDANNVLYGLVSWGPSQCALAGFTGVYTNVAAFRMWIMQNM